MGACGAGNLPAGKGEVLGGIRICQGLGTRAATNEHSKYQAGTAVVLEGTVKWVTIEPGISQVVLPAKLVAQEKVGSGGNYEFLLKPGSYVLESLILGMPGGGETQGPWVGFQVRAGEILHTDIPSGGIPG